MKEKILLILPGILSAILIFPSVINASANSQQAPAQTIYFATNCQNASKGVLSFSGQVVTRSLRKRPKEAVGDQLRFLAGDIHFGESAGGQAGVKVTFVLLSGSRVRITKVKSTSRSLAIAYDAQVDVIRCGTVADGTDSFEVRLPFDPYNAYWLVAKENWRKLKFRGKTLETNPCANPQIVGMPGPARYWYTWDPQAHGVDADGTAFDCRKILLVNRDYELLNGRFKAGTNSAAPLRVEMLRKLPKLSMSLVFGFVSDEPVSETLDSAKKFLLKPSPDLLDLLTVRDTFDHTTQDAAVWAVLDFLSKFQGMVSALSLNVKDDGDDLRFHASGQLKSTGKELDLEIYLGPAGHGVDAQNRFLLSAMSNSQIIFYIGHAGAGQNIDWSSFSSSYPERQHEQFLGVISCYSSSDYTASYERFRRSRGLATDLLLVDFSPYRYLLPLGLVSYLDNQATLADALSTYTESGERVIVLEE